MIRIYPYYHMKSEIISFPDLHPIVRKVRYEFKTYLRILHTDGKYYLQQHYVSFVKEPSMEEGAEYRYFINHMYIATKFNVVDLNAIAPDGTLLFMLDPDQISEEERLKLIL